MDRIASEMNQGRLAMKKNTSIPILQSQPMTRRELIFAAGAGFSGLALTALLDQDNLLGAEPQRKRANPLAAKPPMFPAKAKSVIFLFMYGGVSHVDTFDPKPDLTRHHGKPMNKGKVDVFFGNPGNLMASPYKFKKYGQCGTEVSELYPHMAQKVDDLCLMRSIYTTSNNHSPAIFQMNSGNMRPGNPSLGSWITYGLGSENEDLPAYIVMYDWRGGPIGGAPNWSSGFMPAAFQGTPFRSGNVPIVDLNPPKWVDPHLQRAEVDFFQKMNQEHQERHAAKAVDISKESEATKKLYGIGEKPADYFGRQCLIARRLVERGVRFIQLYSGGGHQQESWDAHYGLHENHSLHCAETDKPMAGLIEDLKARGLLDSTLVVWGGEFG